MDGITILSNLQVMGARRLIVLAPSLQTEQEISSVLDAITEQFGKAQKLVVYLYDNDQAVAWNGYVMVASIVPGKQPTLTANHNSALRRAVYQEFN